MKWRVKPKRTNRLSQTDGQLNYTGKQLSNGTLPRLKPSVATTKDETKPSSKVCFTTLKTVSKNLWVVYIFSSTFIKEKVELLSSASRRLH